MDIQAIVIICIVVIIIMNVWTYHMSPVVCSDIIKRVVTSVENIPQLLQASTQLFLGNRDVTPAANRGARGADAPLARFRSH